jgi:hypothetical protein
MKTLHGIRLDNMSNLTDFYHENGYIFISDYLDKSGLLAFESEFVDCCEVAGIKGNGFSEICKKLDANDKEKLYELHMTTMKLVSFYPSAIRARSLIDKITGGKPVLSISGGYLIGLPEDSRLVYDYHQESNYMTGFDDIFNVHYPLVVKADGTNGSMSILPGSHKSGTLKYHKSRVSENSLTDLRPENMDKILGQFEEFQCVLNLGDIIIFHKDLIHRSNHNFSRECRPAGIHRFTTSLYGSWTRAKPDQL